MFFGYFIVASALAVLAGWEFDIARLESVFPGFVPMNPATAFIFIFCGIAVILSSGTQPERFKAARFFSAAAIIGIAGLKLLNYLGLPFAIDRIAFSNKLDLFSSPSHMSFLSVICFLMVGAAILFLNCKRQGGICPWQYLAMATLTISYLMVVAYEYNSSFVSLTAFLQPMALHTAVLFMFLAFAIIFLRPEDGIMKIVTGKSLGSLIVRRMVPMVLILPPILGWIGFIGLEVGLYDFKFDAALIVTVSILIFQIVIWGVASKIEFLDFETKKAKQEAERLLVDVNQKTVELNDRVEELDKMNKFMVGRELEMVKLKGEIKRLTEAKKSS